MKTHDVLSRKFNIRTNRKVLEKTRGSKCEENEFDTATYAEWRGFPLLPRTAGADNLCYLDIDEEFSPKLNDVRALVAFYHAGDSGIAMEED